MAKIITDDYHAVDASRVGMVSKPDVEALWYVTVQVDGVLTTLSFVSQDARDSFFKEVVNAMGA